MLRKLVALGALVGGTVAGLTLLRRTRGASRERVDLYFEDSSLVTLDELEAAPLLALARKALRAARA
jgi:hypothetical protein